MLRYEEEYNNLSRKVLDTGYDIWNDRVGKYCRTIINHDFVYDVGAKDVPLLTNKQCFSVSAVAEILGYYRRYTNAQQFADIGSPTWFSNANETLAWLLNPNRKGDNDLGLVYGAVTGVNDLLNIYNDLSNGVDNRGEIYQMWRPDYFGQGCLRPCCYEHIWSLVDNKLSLTVIQRSCDVPLGLPFNSLSFYFLLDMMAKITGNVPDKVYHKLINIHVYDDQIEQLENQLSRTPLNIAPKFEISDWVKTLDDVVNVDTHAKEYFTLSGYQHQGKLAFPFSA